MFPFRRLYYLFQGTGLEYVNEETLLHFLYWQSPLFSAVLVVAKTVENFARFPEHPFMFHYSYCANTNFYPRGV